MNTVSIKCGNCGADVEADLDNLSANCPYCGGKLTVDIDRVAELLKEREATKRTGMKTGVLSQIVDEISAAQREKRERDHKLLKALLIFFAVFIGIMLLIALRG